MPLSLLGHVIKSFFLTATRVHFYKRTVSITIMVCVNGLCVIVRVIQPEYIDRPLTLERLLTNQKMGKSFDKEKWERAGEKTDGD